MARGPGFEAVFFDWRGTLVGDPPDAWWVARARQRAGRDDDPVRVGEVCAALCAAAALPEVIAGAANCDCSAELHRAWALDHFARAGLDDVLAAALYDLDFEAASHPFYPDAPQVLHELHARGCRVAVVSDVHFDLRPEFAAAGLGDAVDAFVLSFEHGVQKPAARVFELALAAVGVDPDAALMVGDRASRDAGAIQVGIATWL